MLTLLVQGLGNTTMFCGDGINDLAALSAADVGMAIGATDAVIAAALSTSQGSVAGQQCSTQHSGCTPEPSTIHTVSSVPCSCCCRLASCCGLLPGAGHL